MLAVDHLTKPITLEGQFLVVAGEDSKVGLAFIICYHLKNIIILPLNSDTLKPASPFPLPSHRNWFVWLIKS
jgi:hypothetical protein